VEALQQAMNELKGSGLKMWLYINKNQDDYRFELSRQVCEAWGIKKDSYYDGFKDLVNNGYLRPSKPGSNVYYFHENALAEKPTSGYSEFYITENPKPATENQKTRYEFPKGTAANPERNNIYNTGILQDNTSSDYQKGQGKKKSFSELGF
jgi:hypothetical protein